MLSEFGEKTEAGVTAIACEGEFVDGMEMALPKDRIIEIQEKEDEPGMYKWHENENDYEGWNISRDMIEEFLK